MIYHVETRTCLGNDGTGTEGRPGGRAGRSWQHGPHSSRVLCHLVSLRTHSILAMKC